jgi:pathogenesis-related protein 1
MAARITTLLLCLGVLRVTLAAHNSSHDHFLKPHNGARAEVGARKLSWNATLAAYARRHAERRRLDGCKMAHSRGPYGENVFWGSAGRRWTAADAVKSWVDERSDYDCARNACKRKRVCGHYTQVVWARTKRLGCASVTCDDDDGGGGGTFVVCSYDPPGNVRGEAPYRGCGKDQGMARVYAV